MHPKCKYYQSLLIYFYTYSAVLGVHKSALHQSSVHPQQSEQRSGPGHRDWTLHPDLISHLRPGEDSAEQQWICSLHGRLCTASCGSDCAPPLGVDTFTHGLLTEDAPLRFSSSSADIIASERTGAPGFQNLPQLV
ncbi:hypothetical protein GOODEAATRI_014826 [Goodea atripinnis]|uniref:Uncharacterized protein n=1 Tax=Goodea atripinnis TaxID=208336 RepID=A0ABV0MHT8_9TELE